MFKDTPITVFTANCRQNAANTLYPNKVEIRDADTAARALSRDAVFAEYTDHKRSNANFICSDCLPMDLDNDHSENPEEWITAEEVKSFFEGVPFIIHYSRNHMKEKHGKAARPRFHVLFGIHKTTDPSAYNQLKQRTLAVFPYFDGGAKDNARFFFGTEQPQVEVIDGDRPLDDFLWDFEVAVEMSSPLPKERIPEGQRNTTLSHIAGKLLKRYGDTDEAFKHFEVEFDKCDPPLPAKEFNSIWHSACKFFHNVIEKQSNYQSPGEYRASIGSLKPSDYSDVGQAEVLAREYKSILRYSPATDFICYTGTFWDESKPKSQGVAQELTDRQKEDATAMMAMAKEQLAKTGVDALIAAIGEKKAMERFNKQQLEAYQLYLDAKQYFAYAIKRRVSKNISATLMEARPKVEIRFTELDTKWELLNTPEGTYDLRLGMEGRQDHDPSDFITKITAVSPGTKGAELWEDTLKIFFCEDADLIEFVQRVVGLAAVGKVYVESLIIAYGEGRNGKSTFWNAILRVLGTYGGHISADTLTVGCKRNVKPELAEAKGKRLLIASELEEGQRLNTATIKQLCSTDNIFAEKKYKDPFSFIPNHTLVLYTNHLPKVGANDPGTWRRLLVIPFNAKIEGNSDIKNYADYLFENCGEAILAWIIEGAKKVIEEKFKLKKPACVEAAIAAYRESSDWLEQFLAERCNIEEGLQERSGDLYTAYRTYSIRAGEYTRSTSDFYSALEFAGFKRHKTKNGSRVFGLQLKLDAELEF